MHMFVRCIVLALMSGVFGCQDEVAAPCPNVAGVYLASYQRLDGSCEAFLGNTLKVAADDKGIVTKVENRLSDTVTTEVIFKGCTINVKQSVSADGVMVSEIAGDLQIEDASAMAGMMTRTEYMPDGAVRCHGVFDVPGALLSVGDGHGAQGDGEVCVTAIETALTGKFRITLRRDMTLEWPRR